MAGAPRAPARPHAGTAVLQGGGGSVTAREYAVRFGAAYPGGIFLLSLAGEPDPVAAYARQLVRIGAALDLAVPAGERPNVARLVAMLTEQMSLAEVKNRLSEVVEAVEREHGRLVITKHGRPAAIVVSVDDLEGLEETLDVMGNTGLLHDIREALAERPDSEPIVLSRDEALRLAATE